jgi:hypothetical protein
MRRLVAAWAALVAITVGYLWIDHSADRHGLRVASTVVTGSAICLAMIKVRVIMREFMEVRGDTPLLARLANVLVVVIAAALLTVYFIGRAVA